MKLGRVARDLELDDDALVVPEKIQDGTQATTSQPGNDVEASLAILKLVAKLQLRHRQHPW